MSENPEAAGQRIFSEEDFEELAQYESIYFHIYFNTYMKLKDKNTRKIIRLGKTSFAVTLPIEMAKDLGWKEKQRVAVKRIKGGVAIRDWRK